MEPINIVKLLIEGTICDGECWRFTKSHTPQGYGEIRLKKERYLASRLSASVFHGLNLSITEDIVCHKDKICKFRDCWNPDHIYVGSRSSNALDAIKKHGPFGFIKDFQTHCGVCGLEIIGNNAYKVGKYNKCVNCRRRANRESMRRSAKRLKEKKNVRNVR